MPGKCLYQKPWIEYQDDVKKLVIDADMVYTAINNIGGQPYPDLLPNTGDFSGDNTLFSGMSSLESIEVKRLNLDKVRNISGMFMNNSKLKKVDLSGMVFSNVKDASWLFYNCTSLEEINLDCLKTDNLETAEAMFRDCPILKSVGISSWNTLNLKNTGHMFSGCKALKNISLSGWILNNTEVSGMFADCSSLEKVSLYNVSMESSYKYWTNPMFNNDNSILDYSFADFWKIKDTYVIGEDGSNIWNYDLMIFSLHPLIAEEIVCYRKKMPAWYKEQVEHIQTLDDGWTKVYSSTYKDVYLYYEDNSSLAKDEFPIKDYLNVIIDGMKYAGKISDENAEYIKDAVDMLPEKDNKLISEYGGIKLFFDALKKGGLLTEEGADELKNMVDAGKMFKEIMEKLYKQLDSLP